MPPHPSKVSDEYAFRTPCSKHSIVYSGEAQGSKRHYTYSHCEYTAINFGCRYSHTASNTKRVVKLAKTGSNPRLNIVKLEYGYGFERYGAYERDASGWDIKLNESADLCGSKRWNLPKSLLLAELCTGISKKGDTAPQYEKKQSICLYHNKPNSTCTRGSECKLDHDVIESTRIEALSRKFWDGAPIAIGLDRDYLTVECHVATTGSSGDLNPTVTWKITLKADSLKGIKAGFPDPFGLVRRTDEQVTYEGRDLLEIVKRFESLDSIPNRS